MPCRPCCTVRSVRFRQRAVCSSVRLFKTQRTICCSMGVSGSDILASSLGGGARVRSKAVIEVCLGAGRWYRIAQVAPGSKLPGQSDLRSGLGEPYRGPVPLGMAHQCHEELATQQFCTKLCALVTLTGTSCNCFVEATSY